MFRDLRKYENLHIVLWLLKDTCWVLDWKIAGMIMVVPTVMVAIHIAWRSRKNIADLFHNIAVCSWICANGTWMTGEFFFDDTTRPIATIFFVIGLLVITIYYVFILPLSEKKKTL